jgi:hypothetical protein
LAELALAGLVIAVAIFLRVYLLSTVPLGLRYDEAFNGIDILKILAGERPVFLTGNFGREALFIYLQAVSVGVLGRSALALRVVASGFGMSTVVAAFILMRRLFNRRVAILTCAWLSISLWHVIFSRIGLRTISLPFFAAVTFYCLWRGIEPWVRPEAISTSVPRPLDRRAGAWFAAAGAVLGLSLYTYTAARILPLAILALGSYLLLLCPTGARRWIAGIAITLAIAGVVAAPEAVFFARHPDAFVSRSREVSIFNPDVNGGNVLGALAHATAKTLGMFNIQGDANADRNLPGRPVFDPVSSAFMLLGLGLAGAKLRQPAYGLILIWLGVMVIPGFFAARDAPNFLHFTGLIPAIFVLPALGLAWCWEIWDRRVPRFWRPAWPAALAITFGVGAAVTYRAYFGTWYHSPEVAFLFDSDRWLALEVARRVEPPGSGLVFVGAGDPREPIARYALEGPSQYRSIRAFDGARTLLVPPPGVPATYIFSARDLPPEALAGRAFGSISQLEVARTPAGAPVRRVDWNAPEMSLRPDHPLAFRAGANLEVLGFDLPDRIHANEKLTVRWYWRALHPDAQALTFFNQVYDETGHLRGQLDATPFAPDYLPDGTSGVSWFDLPVDPVPPTGPLTLLVGVYDRSTMDRLPLRDPNGASLGSQITLGPFKLEGTAGPAPSVETAALHHFADQIDLVGYAVHRPTTDGPLKLTLDWGAHGQPARNYTVFVHLLDDRNQIVGQGDAPPRSGRYPTSLWDAGEVVEDPHDVTLPAGTAPGQYHLLVGLYVADTGERLAVLDDRGTTIADSVRLDVPMTVLPGEVRAPGGAG